MHVELTTRNLYGTKALPCATLLPVLFKPAGQMADIDKN